MLWKDDSQICWILRTKTVSSDTVGEYILYVAEIPEDVPDYEFILKCIRENIRIEDVPATE